MTENNYNSEVEVEEVPETELLSDMGNFENVGEMDPDLLPDKYGHESLNTIDVSNDEGMMVLRNAFKPTGHTADPAADPLTVYLSHIRNHPILDSESQQRLAIRYKDHNDLEAGQILVLTNLRLVVKIAREYKRKWTSLLELIQEGNVGLSEAIQRYDPYRSVKFTSYAQYWIRAMILNFLMNHFQPIRIGSTRAGRKLFYNLKKARTELLNEGHTNPTPALVAEKLGVSEKDVVEVSQHLDKPALSIDQNAPGFDNVTIADLLQDEPGASPESKVLKDDFLLKVQETMANFASTLEDPREIAIWRGRLVAFEPITLTDLGKQFNVSKERVRQLETRLKDRFKAYLLEHIDADESTFIDAEE